MAQEFPQSAVLTSALSLVPQARDVSSTVASRLHRDEPQWGLWGEGGLRSRQALRLSAQPGGVAIT